ncbi:MAG: AAA family ATPase [Bacteroidia bacterium]|nr:AAA family ATPase [Bacteroidia bacterium]MDW8158958.1 AAA family ATPase [Bacteroidia bacterium]
MQKISGFLYENILYKSSLSEIYRVTQEKTQKKFLLKIYAENQKSEWAKAKLEIERKQLLTLKNPALLTPLWIEAEKNKYYMVYENQEGGPVLEYLLSSENKVEKFLEVAIAITQALWHLHQKNLVHKSIRTPSLLFDPQSKKCIFLEYEDAYQEKDEDYFLFNPQFWQESLPYIAPEQTGRVSGSIDFRTDLYSLGVVFYELLTGHPPFEAKEPFELLHAHIAKKPLSLTQINPLLPPTINRIVIKLLAKDAEERYQSALGLLEDLSFCQEQYQEKGTLPLIELGKKDLKTELKLPHKLYGRKQEIQLLLQALEKVTTQGGVEVFVVQGASGVGKTALINVVLKPLLREKGYFLSGKFNEWKQPVSLEGWLDALKKIIPQWLCESPSQISAWKEQILQHLGKETAILTKFLPEFEWIVGKSTFSFPQNISLQYKMLQNVLLQLLSLIGRQEHPLVIFLDNLQWADSLSLQLLSALLTLNRPQAMLLALAFREEYHNFSSNLEILLQDIKKNGCNYHPIKLKPLTVEHVAELLCDTLHARLVQVRPLAQILHQKTNGSPYFLQELLKDLYERKLLFYNATQGKWSWDVGQIQKIQLYENVLELLVHKIHKLSSPCKEAVIWASCLGSSFRLQTLAFVLQKPVEEVAALLRGAVHEKLLEVYDTTSYRDPSSLGLVSYRFVHERIQQAAYSTLEEEQKIKFHAQIGKALKNYLSQDAYLIFEVVNHLNWAVALLTPCEKAELVELNYQAGKTAYENKNYLTAQKYFENAIYYLSSSTQKELVVSLFTTALQNALYCQNYGWIDVLANELSKYPLNWQEQISIYQVLMQSSFAQGKFHEGIAIQQKGLELIFTLLPSLSQVTSWQALPSRVKNTFSPKNLERTLRLAPLQNEPAQQAIQLIILGILPCFLVDNQLFLLRIAQLFFLTFNYGRSKEMELILSLGAVVAILLEKDFLGAQKILHFAHSYFGKESASNKWPQTRLLQLLLLEHWYKHPSALQTELWQVYKKAMEIEDSYTAALALNALLLIGLMSGNPLSELEQQLSDTLKAFQRFHMPHFIKLTQLYRQLINNLRESNTANPWVLRSENFDEQVERQRLQEVGDKIALAELSTFKSWLLGIFFPHLQESWDVPSTLLFENIKCWPIYPFAVFQGILLKLQSFGQYEPTHQVTLLQEAQQELQKLVYWQAYFPSLFIYRIEWLKAEIALCQNQLVQAIQHFRKALALMRGITNRAEKAQLLERMARAYLIMQAPSKSKKFIYRAYRVYARWGAQAKCTWLQKEFPFLQTKRFAKTQLPTKSLSSFKTSPHNTTHWLDWNAILKASQMLSQALHLEELMEKLLRLTMENAGATRCVLLLKNQNELFIEAESQILETQIQLHLQKKKISLVNPEALPLSIIHYIAHSLNLVVLNDALVEGHFVNDPYIEAVQPKSILAIPILQQGELLGILYLENTLTRSVFTPERVEILKLLAAQAAISIVNAQFYQMLEQKVEERTQELNSALANLQAAQEQLIATEKLAALGQLIASIAHEMNTPLGVLNGASTNLKNSLPFLLQQLPFLITCLPPEQIELFTQWLLYSAEPNATTLSGIQERNIRKNLTQILSQLPISSPAYYAQELIRAGILDIPAKFWPLFQKEPTYTEQLLNTAAQVGKVHNNLHSMQIAISKMEKIIFALKNYIYQSPASQAQLINLVENIELILTLYRTQLSKVELQKNFPPSLSSLSIYAYPDELGQVWTNLIQNALHAMNNKGTLSISLEKDEKQVYVSFTDSGIGISQEHISKIFTPFFTTKPMGEGSGLGLYVVKKIVDKHKGHITVSSQPGKTTFTVALPLTLE